MVKLFLLFLSLLSCTKLPTKPLVLTPFSPYSTFVKQIAGDTVEVKDLIPYGANPHNFDPSFSQIREIKQAALWFYLGEPFERTIASRIPLKKIDLLENIPLFQPACSLEECQDRHVWLSPKRVVLQLAIIEKALSIAFPEHASFYKEQREKFEKELLELDKTLSLSFHHEIFLISHGALSYFASDYGLTQIPIEEGGKDPQPKRILSLLKEAKDRKAKVVLILDETPNQAAFLLAKKLSLPVKKIDPFGGDYIENLKKIASAIYD